MVGSLGKVASSFRLTREKGGDCTITRRVQKSFSQLSLLGFLRGTGPSQSCPLWTVQTSLPWPPPQPSLVLLPIQKTEEKFFLQRLPTPSAGSHFLLDCPAPEPLWCAISLLPFLTSGPNLGSWPVCWVSVEFLCAPIPGKGSSSTTTFHARSSS